MSLLKQDPSDLVDQRIKEGLAKLDKDPVEKDREDTDEVPASDDQVAMKNKEVDAEDANKE